MSDSLGKAVWKAVWEAADNGNEAELRRLIERGGSVNWHNPEVRRRMCLAWAPASSPPLLLWSPSRGSARRIPTAQAALAFCRRPADPPSLAHTSSWYGARRTPACSPIRLSPLALDDGSCVRPDQRIHSSPTGRIPRAPWVCRTPPRLRGDRGQRHRGKPRACPLPKHMPWVSFHVVISFFSSLLSSEPQRILSSALRGRQGPPRDRQASPRARRGSDAPRHERRHGPLLGTSAWPQRGRGPAERA
jgi:hypothetical protein